MNIQLKEQNPELINIGKYWSKKEDDELLNMIKNNHIENISKYFLRTDGAIRCRIKLLALRLIENNTIEKVSDITNLSINDILSYKEKKENEKSKKEQLVNIGKCWSKEDDNQLLNLIKNNHVENISKYFLRTDYAIRCRIKLLALKYKQSNMKKLYTENNKNKEVMLNDIYQLLSIINTKLDLI